MSSSVSFLFSLFTILTLLGQGSSKYRFQENGRRLYSINSNNVTIAEEVLFPSRTISSSSSIAAYNSLTTGEPKDIHSIYKSKGSKATDAFTSKGKMSNGSKSGSMSFSYTYNPSKSKGSKNTYGNSLSESNRSWSSKADAQLCYSYNLKKGKGSKGSKSEYKSSYSYIYISSKGKGTKASKGKVPKGSQSKSKSSYSSNGKEFKSNNDFNFSKGKATKKSKAESKSYDSLIYNPSKGIGPKSSKSVKIHSEVSQVIIGNATNNTMSNGKIFEFKVGNAPST